MENNNLRKHMDYMIQCTEELQLSERLFNEYKSHYEKVFRYCCEKNLEKFTFDQLEDFMHRTCMGKKKCFTAGARKIAHTVATYFEDGEFRWRRTEKQNYPLSTDYSGIVIRFQQKLLQSLDPGTVRTSSGIIRQFLNYLEASGKHEAALIEDKDVLDFVRQKSKTCRQSMSKLIRTMRKFVCFLRDEDIVNLTADRFLTEAGRCRQKSLPCFTMEEILGIFSAIDRSTDKGRRDYAIFLLALRTGLRASDISRIKLSDIDWKAGSLKVIQKKTGVALELPLPVDAGNAIADYILNSRYESDNEFVFLRIRKTPCRTPMNPTSFNTCLQKYIKVAGMDKAGWDGKSFHAFRRTAGTKMVEANTPASTVAQILGHGSMESSKRYIALDAKKMTYCCLDLGSMGTRKEGLA